MEWTERTLSEEPAINLLVELGYKHISSSELQPQRRSDKDPLIRYSLKEAIRTLNPWISDDNITRVIDKISKIVGTSELEINQKIHEILIKYTSVTQGLGNGPKSQTVKLIDFDNIDNNEFIVVDQFTIEGPKKTIRPDLVIFINGLPLGIIECKNPVAFSNPEEALRQLHRYQSKERGAPRLFRFSQVLVATNDTIAWMGTTHTPEKFFLEWRDPYPMTVPEVAKLTGRENPSSQDLLIAGVFEKSNFLDLIRNFIVFETREGKLIKKIARYQQFRSVNKAIQRIQNTEDSKERGGVIWHTQGSGKSLTMLFLAVKLRRQSFLDNPTVVIVTDRIDLDEQITATFQACNFPNPIQAQSTRHLKSLIKSIDQAPGQTILTTVHKFQESNSSKIYPKLAASSNIFVLVDEAHRTQYKTLALNMRTAIPNATYIAFTGTPLIKEKGNITVDAFHTYIDTYTIEQSVQDGATVPIFYDGRLPQLHVESSMLDDLFDLEFVDYTEDERDEIKSKYSNLRSIIGAEERIKQVALDTFKHFKEYIYPNGFKAQLVAIDRATAVRYKQIWDKLPNAPESAVIMSGSSNDPEEMVRYHTSKDEQKQLIERFKDKEDPLALLIVVDMLLTGFDAPVEQVMYLDRPLKNHGLLQAIARVNRTNEGKDHGLIVDYVGVSRNLEKALSVFNLDDVEHAMDSFDAAKEQLERDHHAIMRMFAGVESSDLDAMRETVVNEPQLSEFISKFKKFQNSVERVLPDPYANDYKADYVMLEKLRNHLRHVLRDERLSPLAVGAKVKELIDEYVRASGVKQIIEPISILSDEFDQMMTKKESKRAKALEMTNAVKTYIQVHFDENPQIFETFSERLQKIIEAYNAGRIDEDEVIEKIREIITEIRTIKDTAQSLGFDETEYAIYQLLENNVKDRTELDFDELSELTKQIMEDLKDNAVPDWKYKEDAQRIMRRDIKRSIRFLIQDYEAITTRIIELAKIRL